MAATPRAPNMTPRRSTARRGRMGPQADRAAGLRRGGAQDERAASDNSAQKNSADERLIIKLNQNTHTIRHFNITLPAP